MNDPIQQKIAEYESIYTALEAWCKSQDLDNAQATGAMCMFIGKRLAAHANDIELLRLGCQIHGSLINSEAARAWMSR